MSLVRSVTEKNYVLPTLFYFGPDHLLPIIEKKGNNLCEGHYHLQGVINLNKFFSVECKYFFHKNSLVC